MQVRMLKIYLRVFACKVMLNVPIHSYAVSQRMFQNSMSRRHRHDLQSNQDPYETESNFEGTSNAVKGIVQSLTNAFVAIAPVYSTKSNLSPAETSNQKPITVKQLYDGIKNDFESKYLWTGVINENLYNENCLFTDPTLSFRGLDTYKKNVGSLRPLVNALVPDFGVDLLSSELDQKALCVRVRWRMWGYISVPWNPTVDVIGRTRFTYDPTLGNRIVDYFETWEIPAKDALMQLITPGKKIFSK